MASDLNSICLTGRLTRDPELRHTQGGTAICHIRLAYTTSRKDASGEWSDKSNYIDVTVWGRRGEVAAQYLGKGSRFGVTGRLEYREWEAKDGSGKRNSYEVVAENFVFLDAKGERREESDESWSGESDFTPPAEREFAPAAAASTSNDPFGGSDVDQDIPFATTIDGFGF
jgi:single-strand DNA-binding protein